MRRLTLASLVAWSFLISAAPKTPSPTSARATPPKPTPATDQADHSPQLNVAKGFEITVEDYDAKTDTFLLSLVSEPGVGPNYVTPENLREGIAFPGDQTSFMRQKSQMIGSIYQIKKPMALVREGEMERRQKKSGP